MKWVSLNSLALLWIMSASLIIGGLFEWPLHIVSAAGQNAGLAFLAAGCWAFLVAALIQAEPPANWFWTKISGALDAFALAGVLAVDAVMVVQLLGMMQTYFYFQTPRWVLTTPLVILTATAASRPGDTRWRVVALWVPVLFVITLPILGLAALLSIRHGRVLLPNSVIAISPLIQGASTIAYMGFPLAVTFRAVRPQMAEPPTLLWRLLAVFLPFIFFAALLFLALGALGVQALVHVRWPVIFTLDHVTVHSAFFLSRMGIIVIFSWSIGVAVGLITHLTLASTATARWPTVSRIVPCLIGAVWLAISFWLPSPEDATAFLMSWIMPAADVYIVVELMLLIAVRLFARTKPARQQTAAHESP